MTLRDLQPEAIDALDAARARAVEVVDPSLMELVTDRIAVSLAGARPQCEATTDRERAVCAVIDQTLVDVAGIEDETVRHASSYFDDGELADLVMAAYIVEARTRLTIAADRLLGGLG